MTHDPFQRFAIIPVPHGPAPKEAIVVGPMSTVMEYIPQSVARDDAMAELARIIHGGVGFWEVSGD